MPVRRDLWWIVTRTRTGIRCGGIETTGETITGGAPCFRWLLGAPRSRLRRHPGLIDIKHAARLPDEKKPGS